MELGPQLYIVLLHRKTSADHACNPVQKLNDQESEKVEFEKPSTKKGIASPRENKEVEFGDEQGPFSAKETLMGLVMGNLHMAPINPL